MLQTLPHDPLLTARFLVRARQTWTYLDGTVGGHTPGRITMGEDNRPALEALRDAIAARLPRGGAPLWITRVWTNLIWQPAHLAILAVHVEHRLPRFTELSQEVAGIHVSGFALPDGPFLAGSEPEMIAKAGGMLRGFAETIIAEIDRLGRLKPVHAHRLLVARLLRVLLFLHHTEPDLIPAADLPRLAGFWLDAMGLAGQGGIEAIPLPGNGQAWIVKRKGCCLDYRDTPDRLCVDCPRQDEAVRHERERAGIMALREAG